MPAISMKVNEKAVCGAVEPRTLLVHFLLRQESKETRARFLAYVHAALAERRGDSATQFESAMGHRIEQFEEPLRRWLESVMGLRR